MVSSAKAKNHSMEAPRQLTRQLCRVLHLKKGQAANALVLTRQVHRVLQLLTSVSMQELAAAEHCSAGGL